MSEFTPGPWRIDGDIKTMTHGCTSVPITCDEHQIAYVFVDDPPGSRANAALIAAAPDLYEALNAIAHLHGAGIHDAPKMARTALLRAQASEHSGG